MLTLLGELAALGTLGMLLAGAAVKTAEADRVRVRAGVEKDGTGRR
ncbi:hypothetical protein [Ruegeria sediminis]|nr:hypothetical protein [Ruegeria sediminis]